MAKLYEIHGIPEQVSLEFDAPPDYATIYSADDGLPWDSSELRHWQVALWGSAHYWTALEAALLISEIDPNDSELYAVSEEIVADTGYGSSYYSWKYEFRWEYAERIYFIFERSPLAPQSSPIEWIRYFAEKLLVDSASLSGSHAIFGGTRFGETWLKFFSSELNLEMHTEQSKRTRPAVVSNKLAILEQAAHKFWSNADPNDPTTHTKNQDVVAWLMDHGYSQSLASSGASIIRPEWAATGRPQEK